MKRIIQITLFMFVALFFTASCKKTMDINKDPNYPDNAPINMLLPSAELSFAGVLGLLIILIII